MRKFSSNNKRKLGAGNPYCEPKLRATLKFRVFLFPLSEICNCLLALSTLLGTVSSFSALMLLGVVTGM